MKLLKTALITLLFINYNSFEKMHLEDNVDCDSVIAKQQENLWKLVEKFQLEYLPNENNQNYKWEYDFSNKQIIVYKNEVKYLKIYFIHVGSINRAQQTWTWANTLKNKNEKLNKIYEFGIKNNCQKLTNNSWLGTDKDAWGMVAITSNILEGKGASRHYTPLAYNYVVFTQIQKLN